MSIDQETVQNALDLLGEPAIIEGFRRLEDALISQWRNSASNEQELREQCYHRLCAIDNLRGQLVNISKDREIRAYAARRREAAI